MKFTPTSEAYNALIGYMNELIDRGYRVEARHSMEEGYGFYIEKNKDNEYIDIFVFNAYDKFEYFIYLKRHNSKYRYDIINDIDLRKETVATELNDDFLEKIKDIVEEYLENY